MKRKWKINNIEELIHYINNISNYFNKKCNWNLDNKDFLLKILKELPNEEYSITKLDRILKGIPLKISNKKRFSNLSLESWKSVGWENEEEIKNKISKLQKLNSKRCVEYWMDKGYSLEESKNQVSNYQRGNSEKAWEDEYKMKKNNPIFKEYWINKGYSLEESKKIVNPSNREYYKYKSDEDYDEYRKRNSERVKKLWEKGVYDEKHLLYRTRYTSKEEKNFFEYLIDKLQIKVTYEPFGINVRKTEIKGYYVVYDGYLKTDKGVILIEYDGEYWHDKRYDDFKDSEILKLRKDVIGVIRITDRYFKDNRENLIKIKNDIKNGINKIKSKKSRKIRY